MEETDTGSGDFSYNFSAISQAQNSTLFSHNNLQTYFV